MAGTIVEWAAFFLAILLFIGSIIAEVQWLSRNGWATTSRATGFVMVSDIVGLGVGGTIVLVAFFGMFMMVMGPAGRGGDSPESAYWVVSAIAMIFPAAIYFFVKRISLLIFKIGSGKSVWLYSLAATVLMFFVVLVPPPLLVYFVVTLWKL